jgi:hypothetical protein
VAAPAGAVAIAGVEEAVRRADPSDVDNTPKWVARSTNYRVAPGRSVPERMKGGAYVPISNQPQPGSTGK